MRPLAVCQFEVNYAWGLRFLQAHEINARTEGDVVFVVGGILDHERHDNRGDGGTEREYSGDVAGCDDRLVLHDEQVGVEVRKDAHVESHYRFR